MNTEGDMAVTITTGTTAPTEVEISGDYVNANAQQLYIYEQTSAGTPSPSNSILLGNTTTTATGGAFGTSGGVRERR
jgi:hypothetical protein